MAFHDSTNHKKPRMFYLVPGEQMLALMPSDEKEPLGPLAGPLNAPELGPEPQPAYNPRKTSQGHARGFFCDRFVY